MTFCQFCGWESTNDDVRVCPKCREYKGLQRGNYSDDYDLDSKIAEYMAANPDWGTDEP